MKRVLRVVALLSLGCTARQECETRCEGCCDEAGLCRSGDDAFACGSGKSCRACLTGQTCSRDAGCKGPERSALFQLQGTNAYVPKSGQGFFYGESTSAFVILSDLDRKVCRHPGEPLTSGEDVLVISSPQGSIPQLERLTFVDGGVLRTPVTGTLQLMSSGSRVTGQLTVDQPGLVLSGTFDVPFCGRL